MDGELDDMGIVWGEEIVPVKAVDALMGDGMTPDEAIPYALLLTRLSRRVKEGKGMPHADVIVVRSLIEHLTDSLLERIGDEYDSAIADWSEAVERALDPSMN